MLVNTRPRNGIPQKGDLIVDTNTQRKVQYDGKQWRRLCSWNKCERKAKAKGYCARHSRELKKHQLALASSLVDDVALFVPNSNEKTMCLPSSNLQQEGERGLRWSPIAFCVDLSWNSDSNISISDSAAPLSEDDQRSSVDGRDVSRATSIRTPMGKFWQDVFLVGSCFENMIRRRCATEPWKKYILPLRISHCIHRYFTMRERPGVQVFALFSNILPSSWSTTPARAKRKNTLAFTEDTGSKHYFYRQRPDSRWYCHELKLTRSR